MDLDSYPDFIPNMATNAGWNLFPKIQSLF